MVLWDNLKQGAGRIGRAVGGVIGKIPTPIKTGAVIAASVLPVGRAAKVAGVLGGKLVGGARVVGSGISNFLRGSSTARKVAVAGALTAGAVVAAPTVAAAAGATLNRGLSAAFGVSPFVLVLVAVGLLWMLGRKG